MNRTPQQPFPPAPARPSTFARRASLAIAIAAAGATAASATAQVRTGQQQQQQRAGTAAPAGGSGLASLSDDALLSELAGRQMQGLLNHAFEANKVPAAQRAAMLAIPAIRRLGDEANPPRPHERVQLINQIGAGADRVVASIDDPKLLMEHSATLIKYGVEPEVNLMEYWGETPKVQNRLRPTVNAVIKMLDKAVVTGTARRTKLEEQLNDGRNTKVEQAWTEADGLVTMAEYTRAMVKYNQAMAVPNNAKGLEERKRIADEAIEFLTAYDNEESGIQAAVRNRLAKLNMVKREYGAANDLFETVVSGQVGDKVKITPPADPAQQYEARYFSVVCEMMLNDLDRARKGLAELIDWQKKAVSDPKFQDNLTAAAEMLRYRILMKERDRAKDPAAKKAAEDKAMAVLLELSEKQPELRPIIAEQLIEAVGDKVDLKNAELLIVQALVSRGMQAREAVEEAGKADPAQAKHIEQAIDAAREVMSRKDPRVTAPTVAATAVNLAQLYEAIDRDVDAVNTYLDYVEKRFGTEPNQKRAFDQAGYLLFQLTKGGADRNDPAISGAWERFLPTAIDKFKRPEFAFDYANRLRAKNPPDYAKAVKYFRMVPANDKRLPAARFREMITLTDWLYGVGPDKKPLLNPQERAAKVQETLKVAEEVKRLAAAEMKAATDKAQQSALRGRIAVVTLTQAELAAGGEKPDWQRVLTSLDGFEKQAAGLDNEAALNKKVMELRVAAYMQLKQFDKAADVLIELLAKEPGGRAAGLVLGILQRLNEDFERARAEGRADDAREILADRAKLAGFLVNWAAESKDPNVSKNLYVYKVYDAETQRLYGTALEGEQRTKQLQKATQAYEAMRSPENVAAYKTFVTERKKDNPQDKTDPEYPDPAVTLGMALTSYDLEDWRTASTEIKRLRFAGKLGNRSRVETDTKTNESKVVPNDQYWEAMYKYYDATRRWAEAAPQDAAATAELEAVKTLLRRDYVAGEVGGTKWRDGFETLRKTLIPDLNLDALRQPTATPPTTEPAPPAEPAEPVAAGGKR